MSPTHADTIFLLGRRTYQPSITRYIELRV